ncbi:MAG: hypothetical protein LW832_07815 [Parachlamydia sp.]|nr:hypothetical protein [Parachlamydia sp.]
MKSSDLSPDHSDKISRGPIKKPSEEPEVFWINGSVFSEDSPKDLSLNHDEYLYGGPGKWPHH